MRRSQGRNFANDAMRRGKTCKSVEEAGKKRTKLWFTNPRSRSSKSIRRRSFLPAAANLRALAPAATAQAVAWLAQGGGCCSAWLRGRTRCARRRAGHSTGAQPPMLTALADEHLRRSDCKTALGW